MGSSGVVRTSIASIAVARTILAVALLPAFFLGPVFSSPHLGFGPNEIAGIGVAALLGLPIAALLRRKIW